MLTARLTTIAAAAGAACAPAAKKEAPSGAVIPAPNVELAPTKARTAPTFGIGGGERDPLTHISFVTPASMTKASVRVVVDRAAATGLNFFALQVDFTNGTWAHGGLQDVDGDDVGTRKRQINWGGLVDRGGGNDDYDKENDRVDVEKIQNPPVGQHVGPYAWKDGVEYELVVERGERVTFPPGDYHLMPDHPAVHVDHARAMWAWKFTVHPTTEPGPTFTAVLHDAADAFASFTVWNESGYGSASTQQHSSWWAPRYATAADATPSEPTSWARY